jgi:uncharacterized protein (TIGR02147 family)
MFEALAVQQILNDELTRCRIKNPSYSVRALAKRLQLSPAMLSLVLNGKRQVSKKMAKHVAERLLLNPGQQDALLSLFEKNKKNEKRLLKTLTVQTDQFQLISDWYHFAILSLMETKDFKSSLPWIAQRLRIGQTAAQSAIDRLKRLGFVLEDTKGKLHLTGGALTTSDGIASSAIRKNHSQVLDIAKEVLCIVPVEKRDFTSITMAIDPSKLPQAKELIREFRDKLSAFMEAGTKREVYNLSMQLIPLTHEGKK